ncbi:MULTISPECIES: sigma D regulator [Shewanella]|jgi:regulator of sigma D|uniref:Rsd/AlgQ-like regulator of RpoD n=1 Tax=Shewanella chilikensis TaxID=558541 RepID=A0A6G7LWD3_9GAMM|nr:MULTISPECIES: sigma D regulator [Shewanella]MBZ4678269.1 anti-RNA polymerase sigma 70 factor [Shewanella sp.]MCA0949916.1 sigma D regulator [Shewanella chilikensis]MCE9851171.1 sigma D regulator [Shewanella chilikensis]MCL1154079.1 sigma D regulator [Shewanella chilikensis]MCL1163171.1 sigma D regulator [Shewanella chilikensis]
MLKQLEQAEQKWGGANALVDQWLNNRRKLLVYYCKLAGLAPYENRDKSLPCVDQVRGFCNLLVDYVSEGHFEVFNRVVDACDEQGQSHKALAQQLLPKIVETTDQALDFSDKYSELESDDLLYQLDKDLAELVHALETRFQLEDRMLEVLHNKKAAPTLN